MVWIFLSFLILVLLYYLSQNPNFAESVKPLMSKIKDSEQMLNFLNDLSKFSGVFCGMGTGKDNDADNKTAGKRASTAADSTHNGAAAEEKNEDCFSAPNHTDPNCDEDKKSPQSPTLGIADEFIQNILDSYLKKK